MIRIIAAIDRHGAIGRNGNLVFHFREDLRRFKALTMGHTLIMGRKTFESLPGVLPGRRSIVISGRAGYDAPGAEVAPDFATALKMAADGPGDTFIIGGASIYAQGLPFADQLDLTLIHEVAEEPDTYFPTIDLDSYRVVSLLPAQSSPCTFATLLRK